MSLDNSARRMRDAAVRYATLGFRIFPTVPGTKFPWKGSHGELDASDNAEHVARVWTELPGSNIAWAPGSSDAWVLDVDERSGGAEWLHTRQRIHGGLPETVHVITPSRGLGGHFWFQKTIGMAALKCPRLSDNWKTGQGDLLACDHVDIKGICAGYVLMPPSRNKQGLYRFESGMTPLELDVAETPAWLSEEIRESAAPMTAVTHHSSVVDPESFYLGQLFSSSGLLGAQIRPGVWHALCPNREQHSGKPRKYAGDVLVFAPPPGRIGGKGWAYCAHAHCRDLMTWLGAA